MTPWTAAHQASLSFTISWSLLKLTSIESVSPSNHLILCSIFVGEKGLDHQVDWLRAIRNPDRPAGCEFEYSAPLAETVLLGNVAPRAGTGKKLLWDGAAITNDATANEYLGTTYRPGWELA